MVSTFPMDTDTVISWQVFGGHPDPADGWLVGLGYRWAGLVSGTCLAQTTRAVVHTDGGKIKQKFRAILSRTSRLNREKRKQLDRED